MDPERPWYETAFDADYPLLQRYEDGWTEVQALSLETLLEVPPRARILDLGCGYGRHCRAWRAGGHNPVGIDLSPHLLQMAREAEPGGAWVRGDFRRLPFAPDRFDAAALMFITFGYFADRAEDLAALREARRVLRPGGGIFLEIKHPGHLRTHIPADASYSLGETEVDESSRIEEVEGEERYIIRRVFRRPGREAHRHRYSIRLYEPEAIRSLLQEAGFANVRLHAEYTGGPASPDRPRLIVTARKGGEE
ncbi:MAG: methyltransferase domain-containing protein [bacterium]